MVVPTVAAITARRSWARCSCSLSGADCLAGCVALLDMVVASHPRSMKEAEPIQLAHYFGVGQGAPDGTLRSGRKQERVHTENTEDHREPPRKNECASREAAFFFLRGSRWSSVFSVWNLPLLALDPTEDPQHRNPVSQQLRCPDALDLPQFVQTSRTHRRDVAQHRVVEDQIGRNRLRLRLRRPPGAQGLEQALRLLAGGSRRVPRDFAVGALTLGRGLASCRSITLASPRRIGRALSCTRNSPPWPAVSTSSAPNAISWRISAAPDTAPRARRRRRRSAAGRGRAAAPLRSARRAARR